MDNVVEVYLGSFNFFSIVTLVIVTSLLGMFFLKDQLP